jgi:hypothetical protein
MKRKLAALGALFTVVAGLFVAPMQAPAQTIIIAPGPPPIERQEVVPGRPGPGWVWIRGHWTWAGRWVWVRGHWARVPRERAVWIPGHWARQGGGWVWVEGHWRY